MTTTFHNLKTALLVAAAFAITAVTGAQAADSLTIDFESSPGLGALPGGVDARTAGDDDQWWVPDNAATSGVVAAGVGLGGTNGLIIGNRGNTNDGVIDNVKSPRLAESAGETGANSGVGGTNASNIRFQSEYWFRTVSDTAVNQFRFRSETYGPDRTTFFGVNGEGDGTLAAHVFGMDAGANFVQSNVASGLNWGEWYRVVTTIDFLDNGPANDIVKYDLFDASSVLLGSATSTTWEEGARQLGYNGGNVYSVDAVQFQARGAFTGDVAYVDNLSYSVSAIPEPASIVMFGMAALGLLVARRRRS